MTGPQIEQWHEPNLQDNQPSQSPATAAAITLAPQLERLPQPRPRWPRRLAIGAGLASVGGLAGLLWWALIRTPPTPYVLDFSPTASEYAVADQETPSLNWQIRHPNQIETLIVRAYSPDGTLVSGPDEYDLSSDLPVSLLPYCEQTRQKLTCREVSTDIRQPGQYIFRLTLVPKARLNLAPIEASSSLVTIAGVPRPSALELAPQQVIYSEAGTQVSANTPNLPPPVGEGGIRVSWIVSHPSTLQDLLLVVKQPGGGTLGGRRFTFRDPQNPAQLTIPEELKPFCQLGEAMVCQGVPTGMTEVGRYQFELTPVPVGLGEGALPEAKLSEVVAIQPRPVRIAAFTINGRNAEPKYLVPVVPGQPIPGFQIGWRVEGGSTAKVELLPSPGTVGLEGMLPLPLSPAGTTTITLRVTDGQNPPIIRAVTFETFDPTPNASAPNTPAVSNPAGGTAANSATAQPQPSPAQPPPDPLGERLRQSPTQGGDPTDLPEGLDNRDPEALDLKF